MARVIDGKSVAKVVREQVAQGVAEFSQRYGRSPGLQVILAGDDAASAVYVRNKERAATEVGIHGRVHRLPAAVGENELKALVLALNEDEAVDGILVQLPMPASVRARVVLEAIEPTKDVDGLHPVNMGGLWSGQPVLAPCTPRGCLELLKQSGAPLEGAHAVVVGRSNLVGKPMAALLLSANATVTIAHSRTRNLPEVCRSADILVAAVGQAKMISGLWIKPGAFVIDVGTSRDDRGALCGDVDFASAEPIAGAITPVPGGVGPMTIAMLLDNTLRAAQAREARR